MAGIDQILADLSGGLHPEGRPRVTLTYAQSLDGSLSARRGFQTQLSGPESLQMTHALRGAHQAILVGIGTVLTDDPRLNVRLANGLDPVAVILDTALRTPVDARLLDIDRQVWIAAGAHAEPARAAALVARGAKILRLAETAQGVDLAQLLECLHKSGIRSVMVEGGARVIHAFLQQGLADWLVLTLAPVLLGGYPTVSGPLFTVDGVKGEYSSPRLLEPRYEQFGADLVLWGRIAYPAALSQSAAASSAESKP